MTLNVDGAGKHFTEAQLNALKTVMNDDAEAQKLLDLFGTEDNEVAGFADEARDILGLNAEMITKISGADEVLKNLKKTTRRRKQQQAQITAIKPAALKQEKKLKNLTQK